MTPREQLDRWVAGDPVHDHDNDQCCPDFSCCVEAIMAPLHERESFRDADDDKRQAMLLIFLRRMVDAELPGKAVYIAGEQTEGTA